MKEDVEGRQPSIAIIVAKPDGQGITAYLALSNHMARHSVEFPAAAAT